MFAGDINNGVQYSNDDGGDFGGGGDCPLNTFCVDVESRFLDAKPTDWKTAFENAPTDVDGYCSVEDV